jgi:hypothetical protein
VNKRNRTGSLLSWFREDGQGCERAAFVCRALLLSQGWRRVTSVCARFRAGMVKTRGAAPAHAQQGPACTAAP